MTNIVINETEYLTKTLETLERTQNEIDSFHQSYKSLRDYIYNVESLDPEFVSIFFNEINHSTVFNIENYTSFAEVKAHLEPYTTTRLSGLSIDWNDIKHLMSLENDYSDKVALLAHTMTFDFMDNVDYMPITKEILQNVSYKEASLLVGIIAFTRQNEAIKNTLYDCLLKENEYKGVIALLSAVSPTTREWLTSKEPPLVVSIESHASHGNMDFLAVEALNELQIESHLRMIESTTVEEL